jgi:hypothetical protein
MAGTVSSPVLAWCLRTRLLATVFLTDLMPPTMSPMPCKGYRWI